jgi:hypothetical protein
MLLGEMDAYHHDECRGIGRAKATGIFSRFILADRPRIRIPPSVGPPAMYDTWAFTASSVPRVTVSMPLSQLAFSGCPGLPWYEEPRRRVRRD